MDKTLDALEHINDGGSDGTVNENYYLRFANTSKEKLDIMIASVTQQEKQAT